VEPNNLACLLEAVLLAHGKALNEDQLLALFEEEQRPSLIELRDALQALMAQSASRGVALVHVASGYRFQVQEAWMSWVHKLSEEKPQKYSRALLETLALIAYKQPVTRGEIEEIRGVSVNPATIKTLEEREWIRVVGHKEVPGRPALFATTKHFLDYFALEHLKDLPPLPTLMVENALAASMDLQAEEGPIEGNTEIIEVDTETIQTLEVVKPL